MIAAEIFSLKELEKSTVYLIEIPFGTSEKVNALEHYLS
jgi:hypothetical protein